MTAHPIKPSNASRLTNSLSDSLSHRSSQSPSQSNVDDACESPGLPGAAAARKSSSDCLATCPILRPLVTYLESLTGPADLDVLAAILRGLEITRADVASWCRFSDVAYQRAMISESEHFQLLLLSWSPGQKSAIHDHAGSACAFRVLEGTGVENAYRCSDRERQLVEGPLYSRRMFEGTVCASAKSDIHEVVNPKANGTNLVTLHCYTPPLKMTSYTLGR